MGLENIRNFSIIAHIDHGKSTLADRILELTGAVDKHDMKDQLLDNMDIERERGITIKLNAVELNYKDYIFHLIDTPGHVDFSYEVSRSLAACEGALLLVDAAQGIEAQTLANFYLALDNNLTIIPVINKIDLPNADIPKRMEELVNVLGFKEDEVILCSAKTGVGVDKILDAIIERIPSPKKSLSDETKAMIFDSYFDSYLGVVASVRLFSGSIKKNDTIKLMSTGATYEVVNVGVNTPKRVEKDELVDGEVGWVNAAIKTIDTVSVGDTITTLRSEAKEVLPGYKEIKPMVYSGIFPIEPNKYEALKEAIEKLKLNDASLIFEPETSEALGFGFRCGFLGLLHMEITEERLRREFGLDIIATSPSVIYEVELTNGETVLLDSPSKMPDKVRIKEIREPFITTSIFVPSEYVGPIMELCQDKRGIYKSIEYINETRVDIHYDLPLAEIVYDFFDKLKSSTKGYASFDYELCGYKAQDLVKMDILINGEVVDALSMIVHKDFAYDRGRRIITSLKNIIPRQLFVVPLQASVGSKVIARDNISQMRKNVLAKCYGGDISRKRKLLEKQKEGKKRMKTIGRVEVPPEAFLSVLETDKGND
ncbi:MAG TPA: translation elongation factor 4 [Bacilli bacterium]|jgi:GTP-binding protein LepA|nr:translation elongation factor 4 [Bacilli bacterium]HPZ24134.1 translation elongation factor 4 [Bacilli bacterium]HQC83853.1 translation elongation factor 4 [Bacilli bacterium]